MVRTQALAAPSAAPILLLLMHGRERPVHGELRLRTLCSPTTKNDLACPHCLFRTDGPLRNLNSPLCSPQAQEFNSAFKRGRGGGGRFWERSEEFGREFQKRPSEQSFDGTQSPPHSPSAPHFTLINIHPVPNP